MYQEKMATLSSTHINPRTCPEKRIPEGGIVKKRKPRSTHGCARCKERKIKCDETKPACLQCRTGRDKKKPCPGYAKPVRFVEWHEPATTTFSDGSSESQAADSLSPELAISIDDVFDASFLDLTQDFGGNGPYLDSMIDLAQPDAQASPVPQLAAGSDLSNDENLQFVAEFHYSPYPDTEENVGSLLADPIEKSRERCNRIGNKSRDRPSGNSSPSFALGTSRTLNALSIPSQPTHMPTMLLEYWFKSVCPILSAFDSPKNPLRRHVTRLWRDSSSIYYALLSMAASCLSDQLPHLSSTQLASHTRGLSEQAMRKEIECLDASSEFADSESILMTCHLLGYSSSWYEGTDLGLGHFTTARKLLRRYGGDQVSSDLQQESYHFFCEGLEYWELLVCAAGAIDFLRPRSAPSTLVESGVLSPNHAESPRGASQNANKAIIPHPITGSGLASEKLLAMVLVVGHKQRTLQRRGSFSSAKDLTLALENVQTAQALEKSILKLEPLIEDHLEDTGDESTPPNHLVKLAEIHKMVALMQLDKNFPDLVRERLACDEDFDVSEHLTDLALLIVEHIGNLPPTSGVRSMLPLLLIITATELRFRVPPGNYQLDDLDDWRLSARDMRIAQARCFVLDSLHMLRRSLPTRPVEKGTQLVQAVWAELDQGKELDWMDLMLRECLATIFC